MSTGIEIQLHFESVEPPRGWLRSGGHREPFAGFLSLFAAIEDALAVQNPTDDHLGTDLAGDDSRP